MTGWRLFSCDDMAGRPSPDRLSAGYVSAKPPVKHSARSRTRKKLLMSFRGRLAVDCDWSLSHIRPQRVELPPESQLKHAFPLRSVTVLLPAETTPVFRRETLAQEVSVAFNGLHVSLLTPAVMDLIRALASLLCRKASVSGAHVDRRDRLPQHPQCIHINQSDVEVVFASNKHGCWGTDVHRSRNYLLTFSNFPPRPLGLNILGSSLCTDAGAQRTL